MSLKSHFTQLLSFKKTLLTVAALGFIIPSIGTAQRAANADTLPLGEQSAQQTALQDGTYLFGQSPQPNQIGNTYVVFSVQSDRAVGAFYQPSSSFDCFSGEVQPNRLALNIVDSYTQAVYPYDVALTLDSSLAAGSAAGVRTLEGFHRIEPPSAQDADILAVCVADLVR